MNRPTSYSSRPSILILGKVSCSFPEIYFRKFLRKSKVVEKLVDPNGNDCEKLETFISLYKGWLSPFSVNGIAYRGFRHMGLMFLSPFSTSSTTFTMVAIAVIAETIVEMTDILQISPKSLF